MIEVERDAFPFMRVRMPERTSSYVIYGDLAGFGEDVLEEALVHDYHVRIHSLHVNRLAYRWSSHLGLVAADRNAFMIAAVLHDVGKAYVPKELVTKPSSLTDAEREVMREHVAHGVRRIKEMKVAGSDMDRVARLVGQHHERFDGWGYPEGLAGDRIDPLARMLSIIDAFSAMNDDRPYRRGMEEADVLAELKRYAGTQFDPELVDSFIALRRENRAITPSETML